MTSLTPRLDKLQANLQINGGMHFWQRGTTFTSMANNTYMCDRIKYQKEVTSAVNTATRSTDVPTFAQAAANIPYSLKITVGTADASLAATDFACIRTIMEGYDFAQIHRGKARLQFWVKTNKTGKYSLRLRNSANDRCYVATYTVVASATWEKKVIDIELDQSGTWVLDNGVGIIIDWCLMAGSTYQTASIAQWQSGDFRGTSDSVNFNDNTANELYLTGIQIIPGDMTSSSETSFSIAGRTISDELMMCQRYYEKSLPVGSAPFTATSDYSFDTGRVDTGSNMIVPVHFKVSKRATPSISMWNTGDGATGFILRAINATAYGQAAGTTTNNTTEHFNFLVTGQSPAGGVATTLSAWVADAEF